ncbi:hypothetical protein QQ054_09950 [Oscillatoria amoena NRMC-F 0135]|nr:hypothetical protein [Oscillatoria amoena NRMC-F 0135]
MMDKGVVAINPKQSIVRNLLQQWMSNLLTLFCLDENLFDE